MPESIGYAVVDLTGNPRMPLSAFARVTDSRLVAIVGETDAALSRDLDVTTYGASEYRQCLDRTDVNAVYLRVPNVMRTDYAVEAARAGVHVLCEPPMGVTADECRRVIRICQKARVKLMVAAAHHFHPAHVEARAVTRAGDLGALKTLSVDYTTLIRDATDVRLQRRMGGGTVYDLGVACIAAARTLFDAEPAQVMAMTARAPRRGGDADEGAVVLVRFPDEQLAHFHTSFGEEPLSVLTLFGEHGYLRLAPAFHPQGAVRMEIVRDGRREQRDFEAADAFETALAHFSDCIRNDREPEPGGLDGLQDTRVVEAIYRSARDGRPVTLPLQQAPPVEHRAG